MPLVQCNAFFLFFFFIGGWRLIYLCGLLSHRPAKCIKTVQIKVQAVVLLKSDLIN